MLELRCERCTLNDGSASLDLRLYFSLWCLFMGEKVLAAAIALIVPGRSVMSEASLLWCKQRQAHGKCLAVLLPGHQKKFFYSILCSHFVMVAACAGKT